MNLTNEQLLDEAYGRATPDVATFLADHPDVHLARLQALSAMLASHIIDSPDHETRQRRSRVRSKVDARIASVRAGMVAG